MDDHSKLTQEPHRSGRFRRGRLLAVSVITLLGGAAVAATEASVRHSSPRRTAARTVATATPTPRAGTRERFATLSKQTSNRCSLTSAELMRYSPTRRLQGSCCSPMDLADYQRQVTDLRKYAAISQIPADPYDISAGLAQQLTRYQQSIHLNPSQQRVYDTAMRSTDEKAPCCCKCWRWTAFQGLADYLIADKGWKAPQIAGLIDDLDGCGGDHTGDHHGGMNSPSPVTA